MKMYRKGFFAVLALIGITSGAMAFIGANQVSQPVIPPVSSTDPNYLTIDTSLVQDKILQGSDGKVSLALTLQGRSIKQHIDKEIQPVDLVVVLDRSGSMQGRKIEDARKAVIQLMQRLTPQDRMAIITYSNHVQKVSPLITMSDENRHRLAGNVRHIISGGGTNLGSGLQKGIATLMQPGDGTRKRKVILISDGLANQGITDPRTLGVMAANGAEHNMGISTVGVGYDFNEVLMTTIADHGTGNYYFLENPATFAKVFEKEFESTRNVVAGGLEIRIPLARGTTLVDAGGFPIDWEGNIAVIKPGDVLSGQTRELFLTFQLPTHKVRSFTVGNISANYLHDGSQYSITNKQLLTVNCVPDEREVVASIDGAAWSEQVVKEEYSKLKDEVASAIRAGKKNEALKTILEYEEKNRAINDNVGSSAVKQNLDKDVAGLRQNVEEIFTGAPAAVEVKKKQQAKTLQYESYRVRRDKQ